MDKLQAANHVHLALEYIRDCAAVPTLISERTAPNHASKHRDILDKVSFTELTASAPEVDRRQVNQASTRTESKPQVPWRFVLRGHLPNFYQQSSEQEGHEDIPESVRKPF